MEIILGVYAIFSFITVAEFFIRMEHHWDVLEGNSVLGVVEKSQMKGKYNTYSKFESLYSYEVGGEKYYSQVGEWEVRDYRKFVMEHPPGTSLRIYYSPTDPDFHFLKRPESKMDLFYRLSKRKRALFMGINVAVLFALVKHEMI